MKTTYTERDTIYGRVITATDEETGTTGKGFTASEALMDLAFRLSRKAETTTR